MARRVSVVVCVVALGGFAWLSVQVYLSKAAPETFEAWAGAHAWIVGPPSEELNEAARLHLEDGLRDLSDRSLKATDRIEAYRESLGVADGLLVRSLRAHPAQAWALAKIAAIRWELDPPVTAEGHAGHMEIIELASRMAPTDPDVQMDLGELLLLTGRREEGKAYLGRAVEMNPGMSDRVVALMSRFFFSPDEMLASLPRSSETMASLRGPFAKAGKGREYASYLDQELGQGNVDAILLRTFGETCTRAGEPRMLLDRLESLGSSSDPSTEAERLLQIAWARLKLGEAAAALEDAELARRQRPGVARYHDQLGLIALRAGRPEIAEQAFRRALAVAVRGSAGARRRGELYRRIGQALDAHGRADQAYDAYRRALALSPEDPHALRRVQEMEAAAGVRQ
jgi:tetratricopeptide (TPR) repeat protein